MRRYDSQQPLISIHIPKTGGTSLESQLEQWFRGRFYNHYYDEQNDSLPPRYEPGPGMCIHGHFNKKRLFGVQDYYPEARQFIAIMRDPFEILVSRYYDVKKREKKGNAYRNGKPLQLTDDLEAYLEKEIRNPDYHPNILDYMPVSFNRKNYKYMIEQHFVYIGITEDLDFSISRLAEKLGMPKQPVEHLNQSERYKTIPSYFRDCYIELHPLENEIYEYVVSNYRQW
jgi:hypothetical protein